jgi:hypothetical protein
MLAYQPDEELKTSQVTLPPPGLNSRGGASGFASSSSPDALDKINLLRPGQAKYGFRHKRKEQEGFHKSIPGGEKTSHIQARCSGARTLFFLPSLNILRIR